MQPLDAANDYTLRGWPVLPLEPRGKRVLAEHGIQGATTDRAQISIWRRQYPDANLAIATGSASNVVILNIDYLNGGRDTLKTLEQENGPLAETIRVITGVGEHRYFSAIGPTASRTIGPGVDLLADGRYACVPPSIHPSGKAYEWDGQQHPHAPLPIWIVTCSEFLQPSVGGENVSLEKSIPVPNRVITPKEKYQHAPLVNLVVRADELMSIDLPEPVWIVPGLLPLGLALFAGKAKSGKSWWALQTAADVARDQGEVLYLALEDTKQRLQTRLRSSLKGSPPPSRLSLLTQGNFPRLDQGGLGLIESWLTSQVSPRLVIVDTLARVRPASRAQTQYSEDYAALEGLKRLADAYGLCVLVIHHTRKMPDVDDPFNEISGTTGLIGCADTAIILDRKRGQDQAALIVTGRDVEQTKINLNWNAQTCRWETVVTLGETLSGARKEINRVLQFRGPLTPAQLKAFVEMPIGTLKSTLHRMVEDEQIINRSGTYEIPATEEASQTATSQETMKP